MSKLYRARSLLYRSQILQVNIRWKALDEIYKIYMLLHRSDLNISANFRHEFLRFFPKDSYLGVLRLFLRVLEVARSRRLGIAGEVSVWQIPENSVKSGPCHFWPLVFVLKNFLLKNLDGRFPYWKNDQ